MDRTFLITSVTAQRRTLFQGTDAADLLVDVFLSYRNQCKYLLHECVIMPDHFHALITPAFEISLERAVQFIKGEFSFRLTSSLPVWSRVLRTIESVTTKTLRSIANTFK